MITKLRMASLPEEKEELPYVSEEEIDLVLLRLKAPSEYSNEQWALRSEGIRIVLKRIRKRILHFGRIYHDWYEKHKQRRLSRLAGRPAVNYNINFELWVDEISDLCISCLINMLNVTIPSVARGMRRQLRNEIMDNLYGLVQTEEQVVDYNLKNITEQMVSVLESEGLSVDDSEIVYRD